MISRLVTLSCLVFCGVFSAILYSQDTPSEPDAVATPAADDLAKKPIVDAKEAAAGARFYVIPVEGPIGEPTLFAIRGGVKEAIEHDFDWVVLDMNTPGGRLDSTLEIMEILDRFPGKTLTYVNAEATSAGAIIASVTDQIYFTSKGTMGSAEPVTGQGEDINESMKRKLMSYLNAKMEAYTDAYPFRSDVIRAMMDPDYEFKIGDEVISPEGELLNLNAKRAHLEYGEPPVPLLGSGIVEELDDLLRSLSPGTEPFVHRFEPTWSLELAEFIVSLAPLLLAIAFITVYIEFQTPGFGVFGVTGVICFLVAMFGHHVAGLSGQEPMLLLLLGIVLLILEVLVAPGALVFAIPGFLIMLVSLIWSMADIWPTETPDYTWTWQMFERPLINLVGGALLGIVIILVLARYMPRSLVWDRMVLQNSIGGTAKGKDETEGGVSGSESLLGATGVASTDLMPSGQIEIDGRRFEAHAAIGSIRRGSKVTVVRKSDFVLEVTEVES